MFDCHKFECGTEYHGMVERYCSYSDLTESSEMNTTSISPMSILFCSVLSSFFVLSVDESFKYLM